MLKKVKVSKLFLENNGFEEISGVKNKTETYMFRSSDEKYATITPKGDIKFMDNSIIKFNEAKRGKIKI